MDFDKTFELATEEIADEYVAGGFDADLKSLDPLAEELEPVEMKAEKELDETEPEKAEPEQEADEVKESKPEEEADEVKESKPEEAKERDTPSPVKTQDNSVQYDFLLAQTARQAAIIEEANKRLAELGQKPIEDPTEDDWLNNPTEAAKKAIAAEKAREAATTEESRVSELRQKQNEVYAHMAEKIPVFQSDPVLQQRWANVFWSNPDFRDAPDGPIKAAQLVAQLFPEYQRGPESSASQVPPPPETPAIPPVNEDPPKDTRTATLKKGAMIGSGKRGTSKVVDIDPKLKQMSRNWGISEDSLKRVI